MENEYKAEGAGPYSGGTALCMGSAVGVGGEAVGGGKGVLVEQAEGR